MLAKALLLGIHKISHVCEELPVQLSWRWSSSIVLTSLLQEDLQKQHATHRCFWYTRWPPPSWDLHIFISRWDGQQAAQGTKEAAGDCLCTLRGAFWEVHLLWDCLQYDPFLHHQAGIQQLPSSHGEHMLCRSQRTYTGSCGMVCWDVFGKDNSSLFLCATSFLRLVVATVMNPW